ncbi:MAG: YihY/virulence factor BrkB family protein [Cytophagales bacterium]|nr:YihY/virulence factor BrkB family protein [Armatimonadota bacterium]
MGRLRAVLLAIIGVRSGAAFGIDALKRGFRRNAEDFERARLKGTGAEAEPYPIMGHKSGNAAAANGDTAALSAKQAFATAPSRGGRRADLTAPEDAPASIPGSEATHDTHLKDVHGPFGYLKELFKRFSGDQCGAWAASLSFFSILSIPPILLCGLAVLGYVIRDPAQATAQVQQLMASVLPGGGDAAKTQAADLIRQLNVEQSVSTLRSQRGIAGIIGVLSLFWAAMQIFVNAATPMNAAFRVKETRGFVKLRLTALALLFGAGLLFLLALTPTIGTQFVGNSKFLGLGSFSETGVALIAVVFTIIGIAINAAMFTVIYRFLPSPAANINWKAAGIGGGVTALLWEAAKQGFAFYVGKYANYDKVYGTLGGLIGLVFWIYYTSMILLLGAEIANLYADVQQARRDKAQA